MSDAGRQMSAFGLIDLDGGDLGMGPVIDKESLDFFCKAIASEMSRMNYGPYKFAFRLNVYDFKNREEAEKILSIFEYRFPKRIKFYKIDNYKLFELRGASGGVVTSWISYIYQEENEDRTCT